MWAVIEAAINFRRTLMNNCLCHLFDDNCTLIIILALIVVFCCCCG